MKKRKNKKSWRKFVIALVGGAVFGYLSGVGSLSFNIPDSYLSLPIWGVVLTAPLAFFIALAVHEGSHFMHFKRGGVEMRALYISALLFIKEKGKWKLKLKPVAPLLLGGIAIPDLPVVKDEKHFKQLQRAYAKAILAGPIGSIVYFAVLTVASLFLMIYLQQPLLRSFLLAYLFFTTLVTLLFIFGSFIKTDLIVGDFPAFKLASNDPFFVAIQLYQYVLFSSEPLKTRQENTYLKSILFEGLQERFEKKDIGPYTLNIIDSLIVEHLTGQLDELPDAIEDYVVWIAQNRRKFFDKTSEIKLILMFHIIYLLYERKVSRAKAFTIYEELLDYLPKSPSMKYYRKQAEHRLNIADHSKFLSDTRNIKTSSISSIFTVFDFFYYDEKLLNKT